MDMSKLKCNYCGEIKEVPLIKEYVYKHKLKSGKRKVNFCSYTCMRYWEKENPNAYVRRDK